MSVRVSTVSPRGDTGGWVYFVDGSRCRYGPTGIVGALTEAHRSAAVAALNEAGITGFDR